MKCLYVRYVLWIWGLDGKCLNYWECMNEDCVRHIVCVCVCVSVCACVRGFASREIFQPRCDWFARLPKATEKKTQMSGQFCHQRWQRQKNEYHEHEAGERARKKLFFLFFLFYAEKHLCCLWENQSEDSSDSVERRGFFVVVSSLLLNPLDVMMGRWYLQDTKMTENNFQKRAKIWQSNKQVKQLAMDFNNYGDSWCKFSGTQFNPIKPKPVCQVTQGAGWAGLEASEHWLAGCGSILETGALIGPSWMLPGLRWALAGRILGSVLCWDWTELHAVWTEASTDWAEVGSYWRQLGLNKGLTKLMTGSLCVSKYSQIMIYANIIYTTEENWTETH